MWTQRLIKQHAAATTGIEQSAAAAARQLTCEVEGARAAFVDAVEKARRSLSDEALAAEMRLRQTRQERLIYALIAANALWVFISTWAGF